MKKLVRLTENDLHRIVKESVKGVLNEDIWDNEMGDTNQSMQTNELSGSETRIAKHLNKLYQQAGWFANEFNKKGLKILKGRGLYRVQVLQKLINFIVQELMAQSNGIYDKPKGGWK